MSIHQHNHTEPVTPERIISVARQWIGTPYRHGASLKQVGCDCLGMVRGVWREIYGEEPETPGVYAPDWAETAARETLLEAAARHMQQKDPSLAIIGDLLVFRWRSGMVAKHLGIMVTKDRFIHAYEGHSVMTSALVPQWRQRIAGVFSFPPIK